MPYLVGTLKTFMVLNCIAMMLLQILVEEASEGDLCVAILPLKMVEK